MVPWDARTRGFVTPSDGSESSCIHSSQKRSGAQWKKLGRQAGPSNIKIHAGIPRCRKAKSGQLSTTLRPVVLL